MFLQSRHISKENLQCEQFPPYLVFDLSGTEDIEHLQK